MTQEEEARYMALALEESRKALPACRPNPPVGCVVTRAGEILAKGFTQPPGRRHAEAMALGNLDESLVGASVFMTLEPCSFHGRTPSCALALIERGVERVFVATLDPHSRNRGAGIRLLREAGVSVEVGVLGARVQEFIGPYLAYS